MKKHTVDCLFLKSMNRFLPLFLAVFFVIILGCKQKRPMKTDGGFSFYVGTYTNGNSQGIYKYSISSQGKLSKIGLVAQTQNPSFLAKSEDGKTLLAVGEIDKNSNGLVKSYAIENDTLIYKSESNSGGAHPCFVAINKNYDVLVANYTGGNVGLLKLNANQKLSELIYVQQHDGKGTTPRQEAPHAHSAWFHPSKNEIISVDLGTNQLWLSEIATENEKVVLTTPNKIDMEVGAGPRHLSFHPNKEWMYVLNELNNTVSLLKKKNGSYQIEQTITSLPIDFNEYSKAADIHISEDGKFLYASNRGHNSIIIFRVNVDNGNLEIVDFQSVLGKNPRNFSISPNNKFIVVANQDSNTLISFKRNNVNGKLEFIDKIEAFSPVCILF